MNYVAYKQSNNLPVKTIESPTEEALHRFYFWAQSTGHEVIRTEYGVDVFPPADYLLDNGEVRKKTQVELINEGMESLDPTEKIEGDQVLKKSRVELVQDGLQEMPEGMQIQDGEFYPIGSTPSRRARAADYVKEMSPEGTFETTTGDWVDAIADYLEQIKTATGEDFPTKLQDLMNKRQEIKARHP